MRREREWARMHYINISHEGVLIELWPADTRQPVTKLWMDRQQLLETLNMIERHRCMDPCTCAVCTSEDLDAQEA